MPSFPLNEGQKIQGEIHSKLHDKIPAKSMHVVKNGVGKSTLQEEGAQKVHSNHQHMNRSDALRPAFRSRDTFDFLAFLFKALRQKECSFLHCWKVRYAPAYHGPAGHCWGRSLASRCKPSAVALSLLTSMHPGLPFWTRNITK